MDLMGISVFILSLTVSAAMGAIAWSIYTGHGYSYVCTEAKAKGYVLEGCK